MKTLTEFDGFYLKTALEKRQALVTEGKTPEELPAALGEALKVEGDRLTHLIGALELIDGRAERLKRVVVYSTAEGEAAPKGTVQKGDKHLLAEYFYIPSPKNEMRPRDRNGRDGRGRDGRGGKKGRGKSDRGGDRPPGRGRDGEPRQARPPRGDRPQGAPRPQRVDRGVGTTGVLPKPLAVPIPVPQQQAPAAIFATQEAGGVMPQAAQGDKTEQLQPRKRKPRPRKHEIAEFKPPVGPDGKPMKIPGDSPVKPLAQPVTTAPVTTTTPATTEAPVGQPEQVSTNDTTSPEGAAPTSDINS